MQRNATDAAFVEMRVHFDHERLRPVPVDKKRVVDFREGRRRELHINHAAPPTTAKGRDLTIFPAFPPRLTMPRTVRTLSHG